VSGLRKKLDVARMLIEDIRATVTEESRRKALIAKQLVLLKRGHLKNNKDCKFWNDRVCGRIHLRILCSARGSRSRLFQTNSRATGKITFI
jgi:hypothetical protein